MKLFKSKSNRESILNLIREFFNSEECSLNHGTDKIESDIESLKVRVHRLECSANSANNADAFEDKTKNELNDCIKAYELKTSRLQAENKSLLNIIEKHLQEIFELRTQIKKKQEMKKIFQETAREYADSVINSFGRNGVPNGISDIKEMLAIAFENGSEWQAKQSPWISVEERLPVANTIVLTKGAYGRLICFLSTLGEWETNANVNKERLAITHWMPIPSFDEALEANKDALKRIKEKGK